MIRDQAIIKKEDHGWCGMIMADNDGKIAVCREQTQHIWRCMNVTATSPAYHVCASGCNLSRSPTSWELQWKSFKHGQKLSVQMALAHGQEHIERSQPGLPRSPRGHLSEWRQMHFVLPRSFARETALAGNAATCSQRGSFHIVSADEKLGAWGEVWGPSADFA